MARNLEAEQERWFLWLPVMFGGGIALYFLLPVEPWTRCRPAAGGGGAGRASRLPRGSGLAALATAALLAVALGVAAGKLRTEACARRCCRSRSAPSTSTASSSWSSRGRRKGQRLTLRVTALEKHEAQEWPARVRVRTMTEAPTLEPGDAVRLKATLSPPPGPALPGDYDFARAAWFQGLGAVGYATAAPRAVDADAVEPPLSLRVTAAVARVRQAIGRRVVEALPGQTGAIANALITGERGGISEATNQAFRDSGPVPHPVDLRPAHGDHGGRGVLLRSAWCWPPFPAIALRYPIKKWAAAGAMVGALRLSDDLGRRVRHRALLHHDLHHVPGRDARPARRWRCATWRWPRWRSCVVWPESLFDPGFQMSFAAVVALVSAYEWLRAARRRSAPQ